VETKALEIYRLKCRAELKGYLNCLFGVCKCLIIWDEVKEGRELSRRRRVSGRYYRAILGARGAGIALTQLYHIMDLAKSLFQTSPCNMQ
jgi:hypothetical protein